MAKKDQFLNTLLKADNTGHSAGKAYSNVLAQYLSGAATAAPKPSYSGSSFNFASYINNHVGGGSTNAKNVGLASQGNKDERGVLGKTFGWLASAGSGLENLYFDIKEGADKHQGFGTILGHELRDVGAALTHIAQPVIDAGPIPVPWEHKVANFTFKYNDQHSGHGYTSGSAILAKEGVKNKFAKYGLGFGLDVLTDPTTFTGIGIPGKLFKGAKGLRKAFEVATDAPRGTASEKAALAVEKGRQAAQEAVGLGVPTNVPSALKSSVARSAVGAETSIAEQAIKGVGLNAVPMPELNKGMQKILLASRDTAVTKTGKFNPLAVQKVLNNIARQGGTLAPTPSPIVAAEGLRGTQAVASARSFSRILNGVKVLKPKQQAKLFDSIYRSTASDKGVLSLTGNMAETSAAVKVRSVTTLPLLKRAEDELSNMGYQFHDWNGSGLKLSDVASEIPKELFSQDLPKVVKAFKSSAAIKDPNVQEYVANALARRNLAVGTVAKDMYDKMAQDAARVQLNVSPARYRNWLNGEADRAFEAARPLGFTDKEANAFKQLFVHHSTVQEVPLMDAYDLIDAVGPRIARSFYDGKRDAKFIQGMNKAIAKSLGQPNGVFGKITGPVKGVEEGLANRFTTWIGRGAMVPKSRSEFSAAQNWAKMRNQWIGQLRKDYSEEEVNNAWLSIMRPIDQLVEGKLDPRVIELSEKFKDYLHNIVGPESPLGKEVAQSTAINSQMLASDLNRHLGAVGSKFRVKPDKQGNWLDSVYDFKTVGKKSEGVDPTTFLYNFDLAIQRTLAEYNLVDDFAMRFGKIPGERGFDRLTHTTPITHQRAAGYKFEKEAATQFNNLLEDLRKGSWRPGSKETQFLTTALRKWKSGVTIYYPAHHIRNLIGDTWLMWASGINNPRVFPKALKIIGSQRGRYQAAMKDPELAKLQNMIEPGSTGWAQTEGRNVITTKGGSNISADEYYHEALSRGILLDAQRIEDLQGESLRGGRSLTRPFGGNLHATISQVSEMREHYIRLAHLVGYVEKHMPSAVAKKLARTEGPLERSKMMQQIFDDAAAEIRKAHPDGTDLTYWEQKYARNLMPFYSWMRKAFPLLLESMMLRPAKVNAYPRAMFGLQGMLGVNAPGPSQPFPEDQLYPDWMVGGGIGPIGDPSSKNPFAHFFGVMGTNAIDAQGHETGYSIIDPGRGALPEGMIGQIFGRGSPGETKHGVTDLANPFIRIISELMTGTKTSGAPISGPQGDGLFSYFAGQAPQTAPLQRFLPGVPLLGKEGQKNREPGPNWESLINALTGAGVTGTGKYIKSAEYDARDRAAKKKKSN